MSTDQFRKIAWLLTIALGFLSENAFTATPDEKPTHCAGDEFTYFSCRLPSADVASICGRDVVMPSGDHDIFLDYRFGPLGEVSFKFPDKPSPAKEGDFLGAYAELSGRNMFIESIGFYSDGLRQEIFDIRGDMNYSGLSRKISGRYSEAECNSGTVTSSMLGLIMQYLPPTPTEAVVTAPPDKRPSHCKGKEVTYFSCKLLDSATVASICGAENNLEGEDRDTLVDFRSGPLGAVEFKFPESPASARDRKVFSEYDRPVMHVELVELIEFPNKGGFRIKTDTDGKTKFIQFTVHNGKKYNQYQCAPETLTDKIKAFRDGYFPSHAISM